MERHAVGGLQHASLRNLSWTIATLGFNCVRLPVSLELWFEDPPVPQDAVAAILGSIGGGALEASTSRISSRSLLDETVAAITDAGLMLILNNHNSKAGWCCDVRSAEGIWSNSAYNASRWLEAVAGMAGRYRGNPFLVGFDLRNEIHDVGERKVSWGTSDDLETDWKVATEAAGVALHEANPDLLVIVTGLCFGLDLRLLEDRPPALPASNKLVWTVHFYSFGRWWVYVLRPFGLTFEGLLAVTAVTLAVSAALLLAALWRGRRVLRAPSVRRRSAVTLLALCGGWLLALALCSLAAELLVREGYRRAGCAVMAHEAEALRGASIALALSGSLTAAAAAAATARQRRRLAPVPPLPDTGGEAAPEGPAAAADAEVPEELDGGSAGVAQGGPEAEGEAEPERPRSEAEVGLPEAQAWPAVRALQRHFCLWMNGAVLLLVLLAAGCPLIFVAAKASSYAMLHDELYDKWVLRDGSAPVWVGEFGEGQNFQGPRDETFWYDMLRFLDEYQLDWSYWPLNGDKWRQGDGEYEDETYGLLSFDYSRVRRPEQLVDLQRLQRARR